MVGSEAGRVPWTRVPEPWAAAMSTLVPGGETGPRPGQALIYVVCGSKGLGKSTLAKLLVNSLLEETPEASRPHGPPLVPCCTGQTHPS